MKDDIRRNGKGYWDPTAFGAIKKIIKEEGEKMILEAKKGEIWEMKQNNGDICFVIVIAAHDTWANTLKLTDKQDLPYSVNCQGLKYTDPGKMTYTFAENFTSFVRKLADDEYDDLMSYVKESLGIRDSKKPAVSEVKKVVVKDEEMEKKLIKAEAERDIYLNLYQNLWHDVLKKERGKE